MGAMNKNINFIHLEIQYAKTDCKNEIYVKNWVRRTWTAKVNPGEKSTARSKSTVKPKKSTVKSPKSKDDVSG